MKDSAADGSRLFPGNNSKIYDERQGTNPRDPDKSLDHTSTMASISWVWDEARRKYYYYDHVRQAYVYQDGDEIA